MPANDRCVEGSLYGIWLGMEHPSRLRPAWLRLLAGVHKKSSMLSSPDTVKKSAVLEYF
jgi:hypothetical protein